MKKICIGVYYNQPFQDFDESLGALLKKFQKYNIAWHMKIALPYKIDVEEVNIKTETIKGLFFTKEVKSYEYLLYFYFENDLTLHEIDCYNMFILGTRMSNTI